MKKLLFYILFFIGLAGCGQKGTNLPDKIKIYQIYEYDNSYGMEEQLPFGGLRGEVKQIVNHIENGGTETYTFHRNGLIDEISTDVFDPTSKQNKIDRIKYIYKYEDDVLYRTIQKNGSKIHEDKTYYRNGLPMLRESKTGTEKWNFDNEGRLTSYSRNGDVLLEKKYMLNSAYEGQWIEEHYYQGYGVDGEYYIEIINYNNANQITHIEHYNGNSKELSYTTEYTYRMDGSYYDDFCSFDKYGNLEGNRYEANDYEYDINGNWIKKISTIWHTDKHWEEIREIIYWDGFILEEEIIPVTSSDADDEADDMVVVEEEIIPIVNAEPVENEDLSEDEAIPYQLVDQRPFFQGSDVNQFSKWVNSRLEYPEIAKRNGVQGRVTLQFTVEKDGSVTKVRVVRGVDPSLDEEAVRVVSMSPKWEPGKHEGHVVPVTYTFPVIFQL